MTNGTRHYFFSAEHCKVCHSTWPSVEQMSKKLGVEVEQVSVDTNEGMMFARRWGVQGLPALVSTDGSNRLEFFVGTNVLDWGE